MPSISDITAFISAHPYMAYGVVFLLALSEAVPVVGAIVPGSALIIAISALVPQGILSVWPLLLAAILGAIAGDGFSYWLGHRYQEEILRRWPLDRHPGSLQNLENELLRDEERLHRPLSLFTFTRAQPNVDAPRQVLAAAIETGRLATRGYSSKGWDGRVLLAQDDADGN